MSPVWIIAGCVSIVHVALSAEWSYTGPVGVDEWGKHFPPCGKNHQSPIEIDDKDVKTFKRLGSFRYRNYNTSTGVSMTLRNNGHSVAVVLGGVTPITIEGGGLPAGEFRAVQLHFHWGENNDHGSEHIINNEAFPMELHIVHVNTKYTNLADAVTKLDGLAVLGFMFQVSEEENTNYNRVLSYLFPIQTPGAELDIPSFPLKSLLPADITKFYRYAGSLTTPPCLESVTWAIFKEPIRISQSQLDRFRVLLDSHAEPLVNNFRPVQPLNKRIITANFDPADDNEEN